MEAMIKTLVVVTVIAILLVLAGIAYLRGKFDGFIAGYNTASRDEQKKYVIERLRLLVACFHFVLAALLYLFLLNNADLAAIIFLVSVALAAVVVIVLARTWAKKR